MKKEELGYHSMFSHRETIPDALEYLRNILNNSDPPSLEHLTGFMVVINTMALEIEKLTDIHHVV